MYVVGQFLGNFATFETLGRMSAAEFALALSRTDHLMNRLAHWNLCRISQSSLATAIKDYETSIERAQLQYAHRTGPKVGDEEPPAKKPRPNEDAAAANEDAAAAVHNNSNSDEDNGNSDEDNGNGEVA